MTGSAVPSRASLLISILRLNLVLTYGIPPGFCGGVHLFIYNRRTPSGQSRVYRVHAFAYRWRSLPRVRRHGSSKPQGNSERVLPWQVTMDQIIFAPLSHTHHWYEVGMLKVPAYIEGRSDEGPRLQRKHKDENEAKQNKAGNTTERRHGICKPNARRIQVRATCG